MSLERDMPLALRLSQGYGELTRLETKACRSGLQALVHCARTMDRDSVDQVLRDRSTAARYEWPSTGPEWLLRIVPTPLVLEGLEVGEHLDMWDALCDFEFQTMR